MIQGFEFADRDFVSFDFLDTVSIQLPKAPRRTGGTPEKENSTEGNAKKRGFISALFSSAAKR